jgi:quercetin 2,3-dioxygenase
VDRKKFLRKSLSGTGVLFSGVSLLNALAENVGLLKVKSCHNDHLLGFNHIENTKSEIMSNKVLHKAETRGHARHGWLESYHTFSFANYYNPERMNFGVLRVLNDDMVAPSMGFSTHAHDNMEIISIPLEGDLEHKDSMGNVAVIRNGDIQVMSAGTGIRHSEFNKNTDNSVKFLQIWLFPNRRNVTPRYDQLTLKAEDRKNRLQQILSPIPEDEGVWIHQDAWFHLGQLDKGVSLEYSLKKKGNGVYVFLLSGKASVDGTELKSRDGLGIWDEEKISISADEHTEILLMEVPMS